MMQAVNTHLFKRYARKEIELEVEEELRFHIELLRRAYIEQGMSPKEAKDATLKRFGDVEQIKGECVEISRRSNPFMRALKSFLILVFLTGVFVRVLSTDIAVGRIGEMLVAVAVLSRLLLYARGLSPSSFLSEKRNTFASDVN
jgi:hypothetical protein